MRAWIATLALIGALGQEQAASPVPPPVARPPIRVRLETALGPIEVDTARAPATAANFLRYVERGDYDGARFHRTVRAGNQPGKTVVIDVVQAGRDPASLRPELPAIPLRRLRPGGRRHGRGAPDPRRPRRRAVAHPAGDDPGGETGRPAAYRVSSIPGKK